MGGDGRLQHCDYTTEFVGFLKELEREGADTELLIVGDTFGFWETTLVQGVEKLDHIIGAHQAIFDQLKLTGARIKVTMMVGNHDYDLACDPAFSGQAQRIQHQAGLKSESDSHLRRQEDLDRTRTAARPVQCFS